jgi:hypothetical protein
MRKILQKYRLQKTIAVILCGICSFGVANSQTVTDKGKVKPEALADIKPMPVYGNWKNFTTKDGLPSDHVYCVRIDGDKVYAGTHDGLAVYEKGKWTTYTTKDGLVHNGVVGIDVSELTGDVWIGTLGGLSRWSGGKFENFTQMNSGMPNDLVYGYMRWERRLVCNRGGRWSL